MKRKPSICFDFLSTSSKALKRTSEEVIIPSSTSSSTKTKKSLLSTADDEKDDTLVTDIVHAIEKHNDHGNIKIDHDSKSDIKSISHNITNNNSGLLISKQKKKIVSVESLTEIVAGNNGDNNNTSEQEEQEEQEEEENIELSNDNNDKYNAMNDGCISLPPVVVVEQSKQQQHKRRKDDFRTGIITEYGVKHFDRNNRFRIERPQRITSIMNALKEVSSSSNCIGSSSSDHHDDSLAKRCYHLEATKTEINTKNNSSRSSNDSSTRKNKEKDTTSHDGMKQTQQNNKDNDDDGALFLDEEDFLQVHKKGYLQRFQRLCGGYGDGNNGGCCSNNERLDAESENYESIYLTRDSLRESKKAASSLCRLVSNVMNDTLDNGFAIIRPPGHHAEPQMAGGFCILNNVAVAAEYAKTKKFNKNNNENNVNKKILIVDWDVHHGNGTQSIFWNDPNVLYFSIHRYEPTFYPFTKAGSPTRIGGSGGGGGSLNNNDSINNNAQGKNINVGWTRKGMGDKEYLAVFDTLLLPIAKEYQPDLILVSAGFDAAKGDLGECNVTPECFGKLTRYLMNINTRIVCTLEGGYKCSILSQCVQEVVRALLDRNYNCNNNNNRCTSLATTDTNATTTPNTKPADILDTIDSTAARNIRSTIEAHKDYWKCLS